MFNGTTRRANTRTDVPAPFPSWLIRRTTNCDSAEMDPLKFPFLHHTHFIRRVERFQNDRYLLAFHQLLNIESLFAKIKSSFSHSLAIIYGSGKAPRGQATWCRKDKGSPRIVGNCQDQIASCRWRHTHSLQNENAFL